jgi:hypothetical protein
MRLINKSYLLTLNQRVQGSSPCAPTKFPRDINDVRKGRRTIVCHTSVRVPQGREIAANSD